MYYKSSLHHAILYYTHHAILLYYTILYCVSQDRTVFHYNGLFSFIFNCSVALFQVLSFLIALQCTTMYHRLHHTISNSTTLH